MQDEGVEFWRFRPLPRERCLGNATVFLVLLFLILFFVLHGKPFADVLFNDGTEFLTAGFANARVYSALSALALLYAALLTSMLGLRTRVAFATAGVLAGPLAVQLQSTQSSAMILVLHMYVCSVASAIVVTSPIFSANLTPDFWKSFFAASTKAIGYVFTLFSAGLAVLQYVSKGLNESIPGYLTSMAYPAGTLLLSLVLLLFWMVIPAWEKYVTTVAGTRSQRT